MDVSFHLSCRWPGLCSCARRRLLRMRKKQPTPRQATSIKNPTMGRTIISTRFFFLPPLSGSGLTEAVVGGRSDVSKTLSGSMINGFPRGTFEWHPSRIASMSKKSLEGYLRWMKVGSQRTIGEYFFIFRQRIAHRAFGNDIIGESSLSTEVVAVQARWIFQVRLKGVL